MANPHREKAESFLDMYESLPEAHVDGRALALFYCALHLVALVFLEEHQLRHKTHAERAAAIMKHYPKIWKHYKPLADAAYDARYSAKPISMRHDEIEYNLKRKYLSAVRKWAVERVGDKAQIGAGVEIRSRVRTPTKRAVRAE